MVTRYKYVKENIYCKLHIPIEWNGLRKVRPKSVTYGLLLVCQFDICTYIYGIEIITVLATKVMVVIQLQYMGSVTIFRFTNIYIYIYIYEVEIKLCTYINVIRFRLQSWHYKYTCKPQQKCEYPMPPDIMKSLVTHSVEQTKRRWSRDRRNNYDKKRHNSVSS
jgi:hypothetical protein